MVDRQTLSPAETVLAELRLSAAEARHRIPHYRRLYASFDDTTYVDIYYKRLVLLKTLTRYRRTESGRFALSSTPALLWVRENFISEGSSVIDLGSGNGLVVALFAQRACRVTGVEINRHLHQEALACIAGLSGLNRLEAQRIELIQGDFFELDLSAFDVIYIYCLLRKAESFDGSTAGKQAIAGDEARRALRRLLIQAGTRFI
jgi:protein-L-isoaspartate O-methyltransferase